MVLDQGSNYEAQPPQARPRIKTQIHRRKKAQAFSALELEWDRTDRLPPPHLRMPPDRMAPATPTSQKPPQK